MCKKYNDVLVFSDMKKFTNVARKIFLVKGIYISNRPPVRNSEI